MNPIIVGLLKIARKIAKWILDLAARRGGKWLGEYISERAEQVFPKKLAAAQKALKKARTELRKRRLQVRIAWLRGKIRRWQDAAKWLAENSGQVDNVVIDNVRQLPAFKKLPEIAKGEVEPKAVAA